MMGGVSPETSWASCKHGIINFVTLLHLVGYFYMNYNMMQVSMNTKIEPLWWVHAQWCVLQDKYERFYDQDSFVYLDGWPSSIFVRLLLLWWRWREADHGNRDISECEHRTHTQSLSSRWGWLVHLWYLHTHGTFSALSFCIPFQLWKIKFQSKLLYMF